MIAITGASGFVGERLCQRTQHEGWQVRRIVRRAEHAGGVVVGNICSDTDFASALAEVACVVHLAARVHVMQDVSADPLAEFRRVNVEGTLNLARQAAAAGVRRFVYVSSVKVNGEATRPGHPFTACDGPSPTDPYGVSKFEAEQGLLSLAREIGMEVVIVRPPLVYGPGVKANFLEMMRWLDRGIPLPLGAIRNKRSLVALDNLVDLIITCIDHPAAANEVFLVSDGEDLSTTDLLRRTAMALGRPSRLIPLPTVMLSAGLSAIGKGDLARRLCDSLQVDISKTRERLGWEPPVKIDVALRKTAEDYLARRTGDAR
ncbi:hypothetical protein Tel_08650 [Candidatus Tenderia electrophaga]|uniref:NAD-dependent epimerase/dehydratase domain-containing protein n=1 Tax=Candidatus Tenderia electrophaga TaxID=1748243 RepID=A0A0S2TDL6_9GAMM|nr:hypothetical protein Tel_08650 [Candidatus Tenderia electrophaga]